jgi:hypothetical protein
LAFRTRTGAFIFLHVGVYYTPDQSEDISKFA